MRTTKSNKTPEAPRAHEALVAELAELLAPAEAAALSRAPRVCRPLVLVVGAPRSGATLVVQALAASGLVAYPTNLLARFAAAPAIGARIQRLLFDPRHARDGELADLAPAALGFESDYGRTTGTLAPNEFTAFWQRFLPSREVEPLGPRVRDVDVAGLRKAFTALTAVLEAPFAAKAPQLMYDLPFFAEAFPEALFVHVVREGVANARSLLDARKKLMGSYERWYGARPPEYWDLVALPPAAQVAGQVFHTNRQIAAALAALPEQRALTVGYEAFCADTSGFLGALRERLGAACESLGVPFTPSESLAPASFEARDRARAKGAEHEAVPDAWLRLTKV